MIPVHNKVVSISDENGFDQHEDFINQLRIEAKKSHVGKIRLAFVRKAQQHLASVSERRLPYHRTKLSVVVEDIEYEEKFTLIKPLRRQSVFELRIDFSSQDWHFRGLFFPKSYQGDVYYCFTKAFVKTRNPPHNPTDAMRDLTVDMLNAVNQSPSDYLK